MILPTPQGGGKKYELLVGWGKNMIIKKMNLNGNLYKTGANEKKFHCTTGENSILKGGGAIIYFRKIYTPGYIKMICCSGCDPKFLKNLKFAKKHNLNKVNLKM